MNDFRSSFDASKKRSFVPIIHRLLQWYPAIHHIEHSNKIDDIRGIDLLAHLDTGEALRIDAKFANYDPVIRYNQKNVNLEIWSSLGKKVGWTRDPSKQTDVVIWHYEDTDRTLLIPFDPLRRCFEAYWKAWAGMYRKLD